ncbi:MAG TPA: sigma 54-interacting transcriptional regulator [Kofleriaceae bacterium]|nr:sigma 54-interacting transcriptional regulator [Kofleriaceae bacterium]
MTAGAAIPWSEVLELQVFKTAAKLIERRWGMGLGYADRAGLTRPPRAVPGRSQCPLVQGREVGERACQEHARSSLVRLAATDGGRPLRLGCHAGLGEIAAPIVVDGELCGALLCGGLLPEESETAPAHEARLSERELRLLQDLMGEIASAIAEELHGRIDVGSAKRDLAREYVTRYSYDAIIGRSPPMQDLYRLLDRVVESDATVLIQGENGTGKELVARAIHYNSARKHRRFVVQNCSAFNDNLLDSELFGHKRGAFTGAIADKQGLFEVADQGTFFLDEIGDMSPSLQVKVLRVLQEGTFTAVGDTTPTQVDVRIIAATNRDLKGMVDRGEFREDLYYRVHVINMVLPPLRERPEDVDLLADHFLTEHARGRRPKRLSDGCRARLRAYQWPGNVRELENEIERLIVLSSDDRTIDEAAISPRIREEPPPPPERAEAARSTNLPEAVHALERKMIAAALTRHRGNKTRAAGDLGISRRNLIRLVQRYGL